MPSELESTPEITPEGCPTPEVSELLRIVAEVLRRVRIWQHGPVRYDDGDQPQPKCSDEQRLGDLLENTSEDASNES